MSIFPIVEALAADLAGARVDPNEAQKVLAYLRSKKDGKLFFEYLRAINRNGGAVIRSGQTLGYYRDLLAACERHLRGMQAGEMAQTLGWAIRLLRYYRAFPDAEIVRPAAPARTPQQAIREQPSHAPQRADQLVQPAPESQAPAPSRPINPQPLPPKAGNDRWGKVTGREGALWIVELEGGFIVKARLARNLTKPYTDDRVSVRIEDKGDTGEIRKVQ